jgi:hypothetical protein
MGKCLVQKRKTLFWRGFIKTGTNIMGDAPIRANFRPITNGRKILIFDGI